VHISLKPCDHRRQPGRYQPMPRCGAPVQITTNSTSSPRTAHCCGLGRDSTLDDSYASMLERLERLERPRAASAGRRRRRVRSAKYEPAQGLEPLLAPRMMLARRASLADEWRAVPTSWTRQALGGDILSMLSKCALTTRKMRKHCFRPSAMFPWTHFHFHGALSAFDEVL
jgi:hypothetical protein